MPPIIHLEETDSTNNFLKNLLLENTVEEGTIVYADFQTAGKGQRGNSWISKKGENLMFSIVLYPSMVKANEQFIISQIVALSVLKCLSKHTSDISIKWPNDIFWKEKKICGILIENTLMDNKIRQSVIGIGINLNQTETADNLPNFISLSQITGIDYNLSPILTEVQENILKLYSEVQKGNSATIIQLYKNSLFRSQGYHLYNDGVSDFYAQIKDIQSDGKLVLVLKDDIEKKFAFKEVIYILS